MLHQTHHADKFPIGWWSGFSALHWCWRGGPGKIASRDEQNPQCFKWFFHPKLDTILYPNFMVLNVGNIWKHSKTTWHLVADLPWFSHAHAWELCLHQLTQLRDNLSFNSSLRDFSCPIMSVAASRFQSQLVIFLLWLSLTVKVSVAHLYGYNQIPQDTWVQFQPQ